jgi:hypothetical protein
MPKAKALLLECLGKVSNRYFPEHTMLIVQFTLHYARNASLPWLTLGNKLTCECSSAVPKSETGKELM